MTPATIRTVLLATASQTVADCVHLVPLEARQIVAFLAFSQFRRVRTEFLSMNQQLTPILQITRVEAAH